MSRYWAKMYILMKGSKYIQKDKYNNPNLYISSEQPYVSVKKDQYSIRKLITENFSLEAVSNLYNKYYTVANSNVIPQMPKEKLFNRLNVVSILMLYHSDALIGANFNILIPLYIKTDKYIEYKESVWDENKQEKTNLIFASQSYLTLHQKYRGKGYGMLLIQESLKILFEGGGLAAYFMNPRARGDNSIMINNRFFPLNFENLDKVKYVYPKNSKTLFQEQIKCTNKFYRVDELNFAEAHKFIVLNIQNKKFAFSPSLAYFQKWIKVFPTYIGKNGDNVEAIFCLNENQILYPIYNNTINTAYVIFSLGINLENINALLVTCKEKYDNLIFYEAGDIDKKILNKIYAQALSPTYINFFNASLYLKPEEFYAPVL